MKQHIDRFNKFSKMIGRGLYVEWKETIEVPRHIKNKEYKKAADQVLDIGKMVGLGVVWIIPGGAAITTVIVKFSHKARPSAFRPDDTQSKTSDKQIDGFLDR